MLLQKCIASVESGISLWNKSFHENMQNEKNNKTTRIYDLEMKLIWKASKSKYSRKTKSISWDDWKIMHHKLNKFCGGF